jgi:hypothetical protein
MNAHPGTFWQKVIKELKSIAGVNVSFFLWFGVLMLLKELMLKDYNIEFSGISIAIITALVMAKVVLIMELIKLGPWVSRQPAIVDVLIRTIMYTLGVLFVLLLEKAFESRHEEGGFGNAMIRVFQHRDMYKVLAGTLVVGLSLFFYNVFSVMKQYFSGRKFINLFFNMSIEEISKQTLDG